MMIPLLYIWLLPFIVALNTNTLYSITKNKIYVSLTNGELISLDYSISGDIAVSEDSLEVLKAPSSNTSLFLVNDTLYGMNGDNDGKMTLVQYNAEADDWQTIKLKCDGINDDWYYSDSSYLTSLDSNEVYVYGGIKDDDITNRLISVDLTTNKVSNITTSAKPQPFYGSSNLLAPFSSSQLLIGGESVGGWLNMYRLATWNFESGWSFQTVSQLNNTDISPRINLLILPIFNKLANNSLEEINNDYEVNKILIIGGETGDSVVSPSAVYLDTSGNDWVYEKTNNVLDIQDYLGFVTVFDNVITITEDSVKRDGYSLKYFDLDFNSLKTFQVPKSETKTEDTTESIQKKAILGTVIPVCALLAIITGGYFIMKKRKQQKLEKELNELNYHFENNYKVDNSGEYIGYQPNLFDSNSTLDVNSIDSFVKKRQEFKSKFMTSQETLNNEYPAIDKHISTDDEVIPSPKPTKTFSKLNKHVIKLRNSMSFSNLPSPEKRTLLDDEASIENFTPTSSPRKLQIHKTPLIIGIGIGLEDFKSLDPNKLDEKPIEMYDDDEYDSENSLDNFDVQVLVSSKRRTTLKVVNPDALSTRLNSVASKLNYSNSISSKLKSTNSVHRPQSEPLDSHLRYRVPSNDNNELD